MANRRISVLDSVTTLDSTDVLPIVNGDNTRKIDLRQLQNFMAMSCRLATTANIDLNVGGLLDIDGISTATGNRILVWQQSNAAENGIYTVADGSWTRAVNFNAAQNMIRGVLIPILEGDSHSGSIFQHTTTQDITVDTTGIAFARATVESGSGIAVNGNAVDLGGDLTQHTTIHNAGFNLDINGPGNLSLSGDGGTSITSATHVSIQGLTYPATDGTSGQVLTTDGVGNLVFQDAAVGGLANLEDNSGHVQNSPLGTGYFQWNDVQLNGSTVENPSGSIYIGGASGSVFLMNTVRINSGSGNEGIITMASHPDANVNLQLNPKGTGYIQIGDNSNALVRELRVNSFDANVDFLLRPKGTGTVQVPTG
ncbi:MAG: hypothetical protein AAF934_05150, partial [Bacteroidota bacterium]